MNTAHDICNAIRALKPDAASTELILCVLAQNLGFADEKSEVAIEDAAVTVGSFVGNQVTLEWLARAERAAKGPI